MEDQTFTELIMPWLQFIGIIVTAAATVALWWVTRVLARETKILSSATKPFVSCALESVPADVKVMNLVVRNSGGGPAFNIKLKVTPAFPDPRTGEPSSKECFAREVLVLPAGAAVQIVGVNGHYTLPDKFEASLIWASRPEPNAKQDELIYNFAPEDGFRGGFATKGIHDIAKSLELIKKTLDKNRI